MPPNFQHNGHLLLAAFILTLLSACGHVIPLPGQDADASRRLQADTLESQGNYAGAAQLYLSAAQNTRAPQQYSLQLLAAGIYIRGGMAAEAHSLLDSLAAAKLTPAQQQWLALRRAALALAEQHPDQALELLQQPAAEPDAQAEYHRLRAEALLLNTRYYASAQERIALDKLPLTAEQHLQNQHALWDALNLLSDTELQQMRKAPPPDALSGWMELVELTRLYLQQPDALAEVVPHWQQRYPNHPASAQFLPELLSSMRAAAQIPARIVILLPQQGELAAPANAIRDGIMAAYYDTPAGTTRPDLEFLDTGTTEAQTVDSYRQAVSDGASFVIGPLRKEDVAALARQPDLPVPVLGLNHVEDDNLSNPQVYQFGLAPEDEAREAARLAWHNGLTSSLALLPDSDWGKRVYAAFADEWQTLGGRILEVQHYDEQAADHSLAINKLLNLDSSKARYQQITRTLGMRLEFEPRRREDADFIFLVASPRQARLIRPQLSFYHATTLPVYSTSRVYTGIQDPARDSDMNGVVFCDTPWILDGRSTGSHLQQAIKDSWPENSSRYARLYALGIDAYRILPYLSRRQDHLFGSYHGVSGNLTIGNHGEINRTLRCARFQNGIPALLDPPATPEVR